MAIMGQTKDLAPADKKLYALRDVTATVDQMSLIASSIMSKKLAAGADAIVLDVKTGSGAFMKEEADAEALAREMVRIGNNAGRKTVALISDMDQPLGFAVGNILEVKEAIDTLQGKGSKELLELCYMLGSHMLILGEKASNLKEAREQLVHTIKEGLALKKFAQFVEAQGGNPEPIFHQELFLEASIVEEVQSIEEGYVEKIHCQEVGNCSLILGGGRETKDSEIDLSVGILMKKKVGDYAKKGDVLALLHGNSMEKMKAAKEKLLGAYTFSQSKVERRPLFHKVITE